MKGTGNQQDYGMRIYDPRLGRFLSVDPIAADYPELTPYQFSSNNPIFNIDWDGLEGRPWYTYDQEYNQMVIDKAPTYYKNVATGFFKSAWSTIKSLAIMTSPVLTPAKMEQNAAMAQAITHPKQTLSNTKAAIKQWGKNLMSSDPAVAGNAFGQGLEFGAEFLIPVPLVKGAAGTRVAGKTVEEILDVSKGIASRGLLEDYALSTKAYKGFENANKTIVANNPVFDLINKAGDVVDVTSTAAKTLNASQFTKKLDRLANLTNANNRTLQIYVKEGKYTAEQLTSLSQKLTDHISTNQLQKTSFAITPIK